MLIKGYLVHAVDVANELHALQYAVGGQIETISLRDEGVMLVDREGMQHGRAYNALASLVAETGIFGDALIVGADGDDFTDVPAKYVVDLLNIGDAFMESEKDRAAHG